MRPILNFRKFDNCQELYRIVNNSAPVLIRKFIFFLAVKHELSESDSNLVRIKCHGTLLKYEMMAIRTSPNIVRTTGYKNKDNLCNHNYYNDDDIINQRYESNRMSECTQSHAMLYY